MYVSVHNYSPIIMSQYNKQSSPQLALQTSFIVLTANCSDGQVRLVDGATDVEGRVEICFSRRWGTISGNGWTLRESTVVCNDLGYEATGKSVDQNNFTFLSPNLCRSKYLCEISNKLNASVFTRCQVHWL